MYPKIVSFGPAKVAGYLHKTSMSNNTVPAFWQEIFSDGRHKKLHQQDFVKTHREYGVCFDSDGDTFSYVVGVEIKDGANVPSEFTACDLPKSEYAVFSAQSMEAIPQAWKEAYDWLHSTESHTYTKGSMDFELYETDCTSCTGNAECEACENNDIKCDVYIAVTKKW